MSEFETLVTTPENLPPGIEYAGFWIRVVASLIDSALFALVISLAVIPWSAITMVSGHIPGVPDGKSVLNIVSTLGCILADAAFVTSGWQATPGKRIMGILVITETGGKLSFLHAIGRNLAQYLSLILFCLGYIMVAFTDQKTGLHDLICSTRVIYGKK